MSATPNINYLKIKGNKLDATASPTASNDSTQGYAVGSVWIDVTNDAVYTCVDATASAAVWNNISSDVNAIHTNVSSEITGLTEKQSLIGGEVMVIEDIFDSSNKKKVEMDNLRDYTKIERVNRNTGVAVNWTTDDDFIDYTAIGGAVTVNAPTGTLRNGDRVEIRFDDDGTARAITWNAVFTGINGITLPSTTIVGDVVAARFRYSGTTSKWECYDIAEAGGSSMPTLSKTFTLESPTASEDITIFRTDVAITVQEVIACSTGTSPSTTYQLKHHTDRSNAGNNLTNSLTTTSNTTGNIATLDDATIPANSWVWIETSAASGTDVYLSIDIRYTED